MGLIPGERLNLITGDNGLGKSFLLECAWWALTGYWADDFPAYPRLGAEGRDARIAYQISGEPKPPEESRYNAVTQEWPRPARDAAVPGLLLYARVDGSFALWDPARDYWPYRSAAPRPRVGRLVLHDREVWDGLGGDLQGRGQGVRCNGLIRDWVAWQSTPDGEPFTAFSAALRRLSPPSGSDIGPLEPGEPVRLPSDVRPIPTLKHPYGLVPVVHASAAVRRIAAMAYLMVWAWEEHKVHSREIRRQPQNRMVVLIDELESHLHPQWQRAILPALLDVAEVLGSEVKAQFLIATHSPLVLASAEPFFDASRDKLFRLDLDRGLFGMCDVSLQEEPFEAFGEVDRWLRSHLFDLKQARSLEAEAAIEEAMALQSQDEVDPADVERVSKRLMQLLPPRDVFWPRWLYFAEEHGVPL